jgi:hypothetical protein
MLAEIFMVRSEAKARLVEEVLPSSTSRFMPFSPRTQFTFKQTDLKAKEAPSEERPVSVVRQGLNGASELLQRRVTLFCLPR